MLLAERKFIHFLVFTFISQENVDPVVFVLRGVVIEGDFSFSIVDFSLVDNGATDLSFCGENRSRNDIFSLTAVDFSLSDGGINFSFCVGVFLSSCKIT